MSLLRDFAAYIENAFTNKVVTGTYSALWLTPSSAKSLYDLYHPFLKKKMEPSRKLHTTITYSKFVPDIEFGVKKVNVLVKPDKFKLALLGNNDTLVLKFASVELQLMHSEEAKLGAVWSYGTYIPHITLATKYTGKFDHLPLPDFPIRFGKYKAEPLKEDWS